MRSKANASILNSEYNPIMPVYRHSFIPGRTYFFAVVKYGYRPSQTPKPAVFCMGDGTLKATVSDNFCTLL
jgi:hypothetical protein